MKNKFCFLFLFSLLVLMACKNESASSTDGDGAIADLEKALETTLDKDKAQQLLTLYQQYIDGHPDDKATNASYLYRMASLHIRQNQFPSAADYLLDVLQKYPGSQVEAASFHLLGDLYITNMNYPELGQDLLQHVSTAFPDYVALESVKKALAPSAKSLPERIAETTADLYEEKTGVPNARMARKYVAACEVYGLLHPNDPLAADQLFKAAMTARSTARNPEKSLKIYDWIYHHFTGYDKSYQALFLKAFTLDNDLKKFEEAKIYYEQFLQKYPNDDFAVSTKFLLENLGKSDEEIIKLFEKKNEK
jgi:tetratricopeptide (TPR) repeat protein